MSSSHPEIQHLERPFVTVVRQREFLSSIRSLFQSRGGLLTSYLRRRKTSRSIEVIVRDWEHHEQAPNFQNLAPMLDLAVAAVISEDIQSAADVIRLVQPRTSHLVLVVLLDESDLSRVQATIWQDGEINSVDTIHLVGAGLTTITFNQHTGNQPITDDQQLRRSRTEGALRYLYEQLQQQHLLFVGAGRGNSELIRQFVSAGLRNVTIVDGDVMGLENLDGMPFAGPADLHKHKAVLLGRSLLSNQPDLTVRCIPAAFGDEMTQRIVHDSRYAAVVSFVDNPAARLAVSQYCRQTETVHMDVGTLIEWRDVEDSEQEQRVMSADIRLLETADGCVACVPDMQNLDDVLYELAAPAGTLKKGQPQNWDDQRAGSLLHVNSGFCSHVVELWFRYLQHKVQGSHWLRIHWPDDGQPEFHEGPVGKSNQCRFCNA